MCKNNVVLSITQRLIAALIALAPCYALFGQTSDTQLVNLSVSPTTTAGMEYDPMGIPILPSLVLDTFDPATGNFTPKEDSSARYSVRSNRTSHAMTARISSMDAQLLAETELKISMKAQSPSNATGSYQKLNENEITLWTYSGKVNAKDLQIFYQLAPLGTALPSYLPPSNITITLTINSS